MAFAYRKRYYEIFDDQAATGSTTAVFVGDAKEVEIVIVGTDTAVATIKVAGGFQTSAEGSGAAVNFGAASSKTNQWTYQAAKNSDSDSVIAGSTGLAISANGTYRLKANTNYIEWIGLAITAYTTGKFSAYVYSKY